MSLNVLTSAPEGAEKRGSGAPAKAWTKGLP